MGSARFTTGLFQVTINYAAANILVLAASTFVVLIVARAFIHHNAPKGTRLLPGPKGYPVVGNLFAIPQRHSWLQFKEWADKYGPIYGLKLGSRQHIVLSTEKVANDLLRERGNYYSSREQTVMASELLSHNLRPLLLPYNERWRRGRRLMHQLTMPAVAVTYEPVQMLESTKALFKLMQNPAAYQQIFEQYSGGLMFRIGYGKEIVTGKEPQLLRILQVNHNLERIASPGSYLVDTIPSLKYLPSWLAPFKQEASRLHAEEYSLFHELLGDVRHAMRQGEAVASFAKQFVLEQERFALSDEEGTYVLGTLFEAGSGTTSAAMMSFCLAMTLFPEWQDLACKEIEEVCGEQIPVFRDVPQLPMVRAVIKEVLRWRPVTAGGVPHQLIRDDVYDGFFLPAGSVVHANQWAIHREPALYPDAERFNPNRWLSPEYPTYREPLSQFPNLQNFSSFGFGRRICPGQNIAERSLYILTARIIWAGRFSKKKDSAGCEIDVPDYDYISGFNTQPNPFPFDYRPRSRAKYVLVETAWNNAQKERAHQ